MYNCAFNYFHHEQLKLVLNFINFTYYIICINSTIAHVLMHPQVYLNQMIPMAAPLDHELSQHAA